MLQKEFEERTKLNVTPEQYKVIEKAYVNGCMDKDEFCREYVKNPLAIVNDLAEQLELAIARVKNIQNKLDDLAGWLIEKGAYLDEDELKQKALQYISKKDYITLMINKGYEFSAADKEMILELI